MIPPDLLDTSLHLQGDVFRNIVSLRESQNLFDDLAGDRAAWDAAIAAEMNTKSRLPTPVVNRPFEGGYGVIQFPFAQPWTRTRFSDGTFGVWYGSSQLATTVYETAHHFRIQLQDTAFINRGQVIRERRVYQVTADALVFDLRDKCNACPALIDPIDYGLTNEVGRAIATGRHPGLITRSARCVGECVALFEPRYLGNVRDHCYLRYTFDPATSCIHVEREIGRIWMTLRQ